MSPPMGEGGWGSFRLVNLIDFQSHTGFPQFYRLPFTLGQPFQIEAEAITHGWPWRDNGAGVFYDISVQEPRTVTDWEGTYTVWDPVPITFYDPASGTATPEPGSLFLLGSGLLIGICHLRKHRSTVADPIVWSAESIASMVSFAAPCLRSREVEQGMLGYVEFDVVPL